MIAVGLSPKARALIQEYRNAPRPTAADRQRVAAALRARLGSTVLPMPPLHHRLMGSRRWQVRSASALGLCVIGSVLFLVRRPIAAAGPATQERSMPLEVALPSAATVVSNQPLETARPSTVAVPSSQPLESVRPSTDASESSAPVTPVRQVQATTATLRRKVAPGGPAQDSLAQEVALLSGAASQVRSGQAAQALLALDEHERRFPNGALGEERHAAKAQALCLLQRFGEGRAELALLAAGSPTAAHAKEVCDSVSNTSKRQ